MLVTPLVSVVCAVYNGEQTIRRSIESVIEQTYANWELVIVNDGSKDTTPAIVEEYIAADKRIRLFTNQKNLGQTASLNEGVKFSRGEWIARIDADDVFFPEKLFLQVNYMQRHPEVALCGTNAICSDSDTGVDSEIRFPETHEEIVKGLFSYSSIIHVSILVNKEKLLEVGEYNTRYQVAADYDLWVRFAKKNLTMHNLQVAAVKFNFTVNSFGRHNQERNQNEFNEINHRYILWGVANYADPKEIDRIANLVLPKDFLTFDQTQTVYGTIISRLIGQGKIKAAVKNLLRFYGALYVRSGNMKHTLSDFPPASAGRLALYPFLAGYPIFVLLKGLQNKAT